MSSVANIVSSVTDDEEMIAAAWLHDVVEDTPATLFEVEKEFGKGVASLVENLTDISKPGDGNRQSRKAIECLQLSDKGKILISSEETMKLVGLDSKRAAKKIVREMKSLRNNLAHAQDIVTYDWAQIVRLTHRLEDTLKIRA